MNEGYKQASEISRNLILTFVFGIVIGTVIGWGARSTLVGTATPNEAPDSALVAGPTPAPEPEPAAPEIEPEPPLVQAELPEPDPAPAPQPPTGSAMFDADVKGLWPAAQLIVGVRGTKADVETLEWLNEFKPGGVVLGPENYTDSLQLSALILQIKKAVGLGTTLADPPLILFEDYGNPYPRLPIATGGDAAAPDLDAALADADELLRQGVAAVLGPALDIYTPGRSEVILERASLGTSAVTVQEPGVAYARRIMDAGMLPVPRHFPGQGLAVFTDAGGWHVPADQMDALAVAMEPFKFAADAGVPGMLVGLMAVPGIDTERPRLPAALSRKLLQVLVREDWGYEGVLIASDLTRHPIAKETPVHELALMALFNGCDAVILKDADRTLLREIGDYMVSVSKRTDYPGGRIEASRARLAAWRARAGKPAAPIVANAPADPQVAPPEAPVPTEMPAPESAPTPPAPAVAEATAPPAETTPAPVDVPPAAESAPQPEVPVVPTETTPAPETTEVPEAPTTPAPETVAAETAPTAPAEVPETTPVVETPMAIKEHTIVKGDSLIVLARRYGVTPAEIRAWNGMESDVIKIGQVLKVAAPETAAPPEAAPAPSETAAPEAAPPTEEVPAESAPSEVPVPEVAPPASEAPAPTEAGTTPVPSEIPVPEAAPPAPVEPAEPVTVPQPPNTDKREHLVAAGQTLGYIANMYGVSVAEIQSWNGLDPGETVINAGATLLVYLPIAEGGAPSTPTPTAAAPVADSGSYETYEVAAGDNLRRIAMRFGTTQQRLIELNNLESADLVKIGQKLKVPRQAAPGTP